MNNRELTEKNVIEMITRICISSTDNQLYIEVFKLQTAIPITITVEDEFLELLTKCYQDIFVLKKLKIKEHKYDNGKKIKYTKNKIAFLRHCADTEVINKYFDQNKEDIEFYDENLGIVRAEWFIFK